MAGGNIIQFVKGGGSIRHEGKDKSVCGRLSLIFLAVLEKSFRITLAKTSTATLIFGYTGCFLILIAI